jgi:hypothetical protein
MSSKPVDHKDPGRLQGATVTTINLSIGELMNFFIIHSLTSFLRDGEISSGPNANSSNSGFRGATLARYRFGGKVCTHSQAFGFCVNTNRSPARRDRQDGI